MVALSKKSKAKKVQSGQRSLELVKQKDASIGKMNVKYKSEKSVYGYSPSVLKSGIQKYARRNEVEKGLWCLVEMDLFAQMEAEDEDLDAYMEKHPEQSRSNILQSAKRIRTNMVNRLVVMTSEEVSISAWWLPAIMRNLYEKWTENRKNPLSRKYLVEMYRYLSMQRMIRLISDLKSVYVLPPYYVKPKQMKDFKQIHERIQEKYPAVFSGQANIGDVDWNLDNYPTHLQPIIKGIVFNLEAGNDNVFYWVSRLCDLEKQNSVSKYRYVKMLWPLLHRFFDRNVELKCVRNTISALEWFFKKMGHQEKPIYLYHAILLAVRRNEIDWSSHNPGIDTPIADVMKLYNEHIAGGKMPMDSYILDLHTHGGKRNRDCLKNFALEGAYIKNENRTFLRKEYRKIYVMLKQELDNYNYHEGISK